MVPSAADGLRTARMAWGSASSQAEVRAASTGWNLRRTKILSAQAFVASQNGSSARMRANKGGSIRWMASSSSQTPASQMPLSGQPDRFVVPVGTVSAASRNSNHGCVASFTNIWPAITPSSSRPSAHIVSAPHAHHPRYQPARPRTVPARLAQAGLRTLPCATRNFTSQPIANDMPKAMNTLMTTGAWMISHAYSHANGSSALETMKAIGYATAGTRPEGR
ncbi:hypothetical protein [Massilia sp. Se16.2.3]|uniref:hypothetical protein n=1 Tax=Massilia sp. Se16.2.3 TaxID=2709303 RepID=UPI00160358E1|nr:hypothetical protein [Massilia sp. Se16.2.3]QNA99668.1 hypothetical protein G4G31_13830 [Massilia sp. Se16.2.3]